MSRKPFIRCVATCADGSRCAKAARRGSSPALCTFHDGSTQSPVVMPDDQIDEEKILRRLMRDADASIRLRAVSAWIDYKAKRATICPECARRAESNRLSDSFVQALTSEERERFVACITQYRALKQDVYARNPQLRPEPEPEPPPAPEPSHAVLVQREPDPVLPEPLPVPVTIESEPIQLTAPYKLPCHCWADVGLFEKNGVITHTLGDEHAQRILDGTVTLEQALHDYERARRQAMQLAPERAL